MGKMAKFTRMIMIIQKKIVAILFSLNALPGIFFQVVDHHSLF